METKPLTIIAFLTWEEQAFFHKVKDHHACERLFIDTIVEHRFCFDGYTHQRSMVPLFSDGTVLPLTFRSLGTVMAAAWSRINDPKVSYDYMDFYIDSPFGMEFNLIPNDENSFIKESLFERPDLYPPTKFVLFH